ncbi:MAG: SEC-C metal-binding domain-containing protein [bacterium]
MKPGRNDPCHCGSGKKYKKCHLSIDDERAREVKQLDTLAEWISFYTRALEDDVIERARGEEAVQSQARRWFGEALPEDPLADQHFRRHALLDLAIAEGRTLIAGADIEAPAGEPGRVEALRDALARSWLSLHEVTACKRGRGIRLVDRLTGRSRFIEDPALADQLEPLEVVLGRVVILDKQPMLLDGWEKLYFRGRKAALRDVDAMLTGDGFEADDSDGRILWLRREAARVAERARAARPAA